MTVDGLRPLNTLELGYQGNQRNISCIPLGLYHCIFEDRHYHVYSVPGRSGIEIHSGNTTGDTRGCILLGEYYKDNFLFHSKKAVSEFEKYMQKKPFWLLIQGFCSETWEV